MKITSSALACLFLFGTGSVLAQTSNIIDHYTLSLGTYISSDKATLRVDGSGGTPGTPIDFDKTFGLGNNADLARFNFDWRLARKHVISFGGYRTSRENSKRLTHDIEFDGQTFHVDTVVSGKLAIQFWDAEYTYYPYLREDRALGLTFSLVTMAVSAQLTNAPTSGSDVNELSRRSSADLPAPGLGISYRHRFAHSWEFNTRASVLPKITVDKYNAKTENLYAALEYRFLNHYSVGAAYDYFSVTAGVDATRVNFSGVFEYKIQGPIGYARFYW